MLSLAKRVIHQTLNDKRSMAMILIAPLLILTLIYILLGDSDYRPTIGIQEDQMPSQLVNALKKQDMDMVSIPSRNLNALDYLKEHEEMDAIFMVTNDGVNISMYEASAKSSKAMSSIQSAMTVVNPTMKMTTNFVYGNQNDSTFDSMGYIFLGIFSFFLIFIISGMALVREQSNGTLERLLMTPIKRGEIILGYTLGYGIFAVIQAILIVLYSIYILGLHCQGNVLLVILMMVLMAIIAVFFGAMISVFSSSELQVVQFIPLAIIPQVFFSGLIPLDTIPYGLGNLCYLTPVYYGCTSIKKVMVEAGGISAIWPFVVALFIYACIIYVLNTWALKKYRSL